MAILRTLEKGDQRSIWSVFNVESSPTGDHEAELAGCVGQLAERVPAFVAGQQGCPDLVERSGFTFDVEEVNESGGPAVNLIGVCNSCGTTCEEGSYYSRRASVQVHRPASLPPCSVVNASPIFWARPKNMLLNE